MKSVTGQVLPPHPVQQKAKAVKRIKIPVLMIAGLAVVFLGIIATFLPYFVFTGDPNDFERDKNDYFIDFQPGETREVRGDISYKVQCSNGFIFELEGDGKFKSTTGTDLVGGRSYSEYTVNAREDPDMTFWSETDIGSVGDTVFLEVIVETDTAEVYQWLENTGNEPSILKYFIFGPIIIILGSVLFLIGFMGKKDKSMDEYLKAHPELRRGEIVLSDYQKQQLEMEKQKARQARDIYGPPQSGPPPGGPPYGPPPQGPPPGGPPYGPPPQGPPPGGPPYGPPPQGPPPGGLPYGPPPQGPPPQGPPPQGPPGAMAGPRQKPTSGTCKQCGQLALAFNDDGTGQCTNCQRTFVWDPSRAPQQQPQGPPPAQPQGAPPQTLNFEPPQ